MLVLQTLAVPDRSQPTNFRSSPSSPCKLKDTWSSLIGSLHAPSSYLAFLVQYGWVDQMPEDCRRIMSITHIEQNSIGRTHPYLTVSQLLCSPPAQRLPLCPGASGLMEPQELRVLRHGLRVIEDGPFPAKFRDFARSLSLSNRPERARLLDCALGCSFVQ